MILKVKTNYGEIEVEYDKPCLEMVGCRGCKEKIFWVRTKAGKNMPVALDKDGSFISHFANCPAAQGFRKPAVKQEENIDDRVLCKKCRREFKGGGENCPDCEKDIEDLF